MATKLISFDVFVIVATLRPCNITLSWPLMTPAGVRRSSRGLDADRV
jgi:hypothetical protein